ncbi:TRAP transporter large permease [Lentisphaerota bacterium WC36G]|nr:TRAP transporter large permease [Lentisphaerae bacterium WC36]
MTEVLIILLISFTAMLLINVPIAIAIGMATLLSILTFVDGACSLVANKMANGVSSTSLLAIPFFILSGILMGNGGIAHRLIRFATALVSWFPGGLAFVNTLTCMLFGALSGSAAAAVSSIGGFMIPEMNKKGYPKEFNIAVTVTAATTGLLIPPSNIMIVYAVAAGDVNIGALFIAGILPGVVIGLCIMAVCLIFAVKSGRKFAKFSFEGFAKGFTEVLVSFFGALPGLLLIVIVIGGILGGFFTATEASGVAVAYTLILGFIYREVKVSHMPDILLQSAKITAVAMLLIASCSAMSWLLTIQNVPQTISETLIGISDKPWVILMIINVLLLVVGTFMDMTPAVLIFTPIFLPVMEDIGIDPIHFGIFMIANLCIGLCTPPVGSCLFIGCSVGKSSISKVTKPMIPFFIAMIVALGLITYIPQLSLWLPKLVDEIRMMFKI